VSAWDQSGLGRRLYAAVLCCAPLAAQTAPLDCSVAAPVTIVRSEGQAELLPTIGISCTGGPPNSMTRLTVEMNPATLRIFPDPGVLIPNSGPVVPGARTAAGGLIWETPVSQPGAGRIDLRIANVRVSAPGTTAGTADVTVRAGNQTAGSGKVQVEPRRAARIDQRRCDDSGDGGFSTPVSGALNPGVAQGRPGPAEITYNVRFREGFSNAFRNRTAEGGIAVPGGGTAGAATNGTRFLVRIRNLADGVTVLATTGGVPGAGTSRSLQARLVTADSNGDGGGGAVSPDSFGACGAMGQIPMARIPVAGGAAVIVWEVTASDPAAIEQFSGGIAYAFTAPPKEPPAAAGTLAPVSTGRSAAAPRFTESAAPRTVSLQRGLTFTASAGSAAPPQQVALSTRNPAVRIETGVFPLASGATPPNFLNARLLQPGMAEVRVDSSTLPAGTYTGFVAFDGDPVTVLVNVAGAGADPGPIVQPEGFLITVPFGAQRTESRAFTISNTGSAPLTYNVPDVQVTGSVGPGQSVTRTFSFAIVGTLPPGVYPFTFPISFSSGVRRNLVVRVILLPRAPAGAASPRLAAVPGCESNRLVAVLERVGGVPVLATSYPVNVEALVSDNCGQPVDNAAVEVSFSSEPTILPLQSNGDGRYSATWTPIQPRAGATLQVRARLDGYADGEATTTRDIAAPASPAAPVIGAIQNAASQRPGAAPGAAMSIYGLNFAAGLNPAQAFPLPARLGGAVALVDLAEAPLLFTAPNQVNLVLPQTLEPGRHTVIVRTPSSISLSVPFDVDAVAPGVFTTNSQGTGQAAVVFAGTRTVADIGRRARNGDFLEIYLTGLGRTAPLADVAMAAPGVEPLARTLGDPVAVTVGGVPAPIQYTGLTPGLSGLYQINVQVPPGVPGGDSTPVLVRVGGIEAPAVTIATQ